jgi:predicted ATPase/DNA-binding SARP family transcriptional activator
MEFGILGPLEVTSAGDTVAVPGARQRTLLAVLAVHLGEVVSVDRLVDMIWGEEPPANPRNALQSQVSQLRRHLGDEGQGLVVSQPPGYVLRADPDTVDAARFEALVREGREALRDGDQDRAAGRLGAALELWRGPPLGEFAGHAFADLAAARLEELRLGAVEDRIEAGLRAGRHAELVADLETLVAEHPLRERPRGQLMLALSRAGRQADALEVFRDTRRVLDEELGIDPGRDLVSLYEKLLRQEDEAPAAVPAAQASPPSSEVLPSVLPRPLSSFIGRSDDLERVVGLLGGSRLVTLTGPGGVGKTRLAIEAAARAVDGDSDTEAVWLVELGGLRHPDLVAAAVAETLGLTDGSGLAGTASAPHQAGARVIAALRRRSALLVLDNCEHLVDPVAGFVRDLLGATAALSVLCTSREALGIAGETVWSVPSLPLPPPEQQVGVDDLARWGATALFLDRTRLADPDLVIDDADAWRVVQLCRRLDGIPLALELAAARVAMLGLADLADRLDDRFAVLTGGDRTAQPRQRTLQAVIGWSWDLLDEAERALFRRLSVFAGGATLDAVEGVCSDRDELPRDGVLELMASLVGKSMVVADRHDRPTRYRMLESLHAFATDRLADRGEAETFRRRHADHMQALAARTVPRLRTRTQQRAMEELDDLLDDLRAALTWAEETGDGQRGGRLATELGWYFYLRGHGAEGARWLTTFATRAAPREAALARLWSALLAPAADQTPDLPAELQDAAGVLDEHGTLTDRAFAALVIAVVRIAFGDATGADEQLRSARALIEPDGEEADVAVADLLTGNVRLIVGDVGGARPWLEGALDRFTGLGDRWGEVQCRVALLSCAEMTGDLTGALRHADRGIALTGELRLAELEAVLHSRRATVAVLAGDEEVAETSLRRSRHLAEELGAEMVAGTVDLAAGFVALRTGRLREAERCFQRVLDRFGDTPLPVVRTYALARLGTVAELTGDLDRAVTLHRDSYHVACRTGDPRSVALALEGLAAAHAAAGRSEDAAVLLGAAEARRDSVGLPLPAVERTDVDRAETTARSELGDERFAAARERGRSLADDQLPV